MAKNNGDMTGWVGWVGFASLVLLISGVFSGIAGFAAIFRDTVVFANGSVWMFSQTQWGWVHIIVGLLAMLAAGSLAAGHMYGRIIAVLVALASLVANMAFIPVYPIWSIMIIVVDLLVIYAVTVHGKEVKNLE